VLDKKRIRDVLAGSGCFQVDWYLAKYGDFFSRDIDPLDDYINNGVRAGRNPNPFFDNDFYSEQVPNLPAETNPLLHYSMFGWQEFLDPGPEFSSWWYCIKHLGAQPNAQNPLAHFLAQGQAQNLSTTLASDGLLNIDEKSTFNTRSIALFQSLSMTAELASKLSRSLERLQQYDLADMFVVKACELEPGNPVWFVQLAKVLQYRGGWGRISLAMRRALELDNRQAEWWFLDAQASERLERYEAAASSYRKALELDPHDAQWYYRLGRCEEAAGHQQAAALAYQQALEHSPDTIKKVGVGGLHEADEAWQMAAQAYAGEVIRAPSAELHRRHGGMLECEYLWEEAESAYRAAIALDSSKAEYYFRLGCVLERLERYEEAAYSYRMATECSETSQPDWHYRLGYVLYQAGEYQAAYQAWLQALPIKISEGAAVQNVADLELRLAQDRRNSDLHFLLGQAREAAGDLQGASKAYAEAAARRSDYSASDYFHLGRMLAELGLYAEACEAFREIREFKRLSAPVADLGQPDLKKRYAECLATLDVRSEVVLYECFHGASMSCNPYALFRYFLSESQFKDILHVWALKSEEDIPEQYQIMPNVVFVRHGSYGYLRYLASAQYLINNSTFLPYFVRRPEQKYLSTWHGTPLKTLGCDIPGRAFDHKNTVRNLMQTTHLIYANDHTLKVFLESHQAVDLFVGRCLGTGQPRSDLMLNADEQRRARLRARLGIDNDLPVLLYAPTWRGPLASPEVDPERLLSDIKVLIDHPVNVVFSGHHIVKKHMDCRALGVFTLDEGVDTTEFLSVVDVLVTDYSSVMFDFLPMRRPILLYAYDLEQYRSERGLYFELHEIPARICQSQDELRDAVSVALAGSVAAEVEFDLAIARFCPWEDGSASRRAIDFFLKDIGSNERHACGRPRWLFYAGPFNPSGLTASFLRLASKLEKSNSINLAVDPWLLESYPQRMHRFTEVVDKVNTLGRISFPVASAEEQWVDRLFRRAGGKVSKHAKSLLVGMYQREFRRLYGDVRFDAVIDFFGYNNFWRPLFALGRPAGTPGILWLHHDMMSEKIHRFPSLESGFALLEDFDRIVSVSEGVNQVNVRNLATTYQVPTERFVTVPNLIDPPWLLERADEPLSASLMGWADEAKILIGTAARLSVEKGLDRLIEAFSRFVVDHPGARLVIAGQGPLRDELIRQIVALDLEHCVKLTGYLENPYPLMKRLDLFVLPSHYEGQGIVLLEALVLGGAVMATDIPGARDVLQGTRGVLVESSVEGLLRGMTTFVEQGFSIEAFDSDGYVSGALNAFRSALGAGPVEGGTEDYALFPSYHAEAS